MLLILLLLLRREMSLNDDTSVKSVYRLLSSFSFVTTNKSPDATRIKRRLIRNHNEAWAWGRAFSLEGIARAHARDRLDGSAFKAGLGPRVAGGKSDVLARRKQ